jgi:hypothetical protein
MVRTGARGLSRFLHWRARREAHALDRAPKPRDPAFRGFIQVNFIRPH